MSHGLNITTDTQLQNLSFYLSQLVAEREEKPLSNNHTNKAKINCVKCQKGEIHANMNSHKND